MVLASVVVGLVTAWSYGPRAGLNAAAATFALFLVAFFVPGLALYVYLAVAVGVAGIAAAGARRPRHPATKRIVELARAVWKRRG